MPALFLACAALGACVLLLQILLGFFGVDADTGGPEGMTAGSVGEGLDLRSVRSVAAGVAFFGFGGASALALGLPTFLALPVALVTGAVALVGTAMLMRQVLRLESDGSLRIASAVGTPGTVYLAIPGEQQGPGKVLLALQGRTVELQAVTAGQPIARGEPVVVVSVVDPDTVEVIPTSSVEEALHDHR